VLALKRGSYYVGVRSRRRRFPGWRVRMWRVSGTAFERWWEYMRCFTMRPAPAEKYGL
jgi:hypothetical protein